LPPKKMSRNSQSSQSSQGHREDDKREEVVGRIMRMMLFKHTKKLPVKQAAISKECKERGWTKFQDIIQEAKKRFDTLFGYDLVEIPPWAMPGTPAGSPAAKKAKTGLYILTNISHEADEKKEVNQPACQDHPHLGLLMTVLSLILLNKGKIKENMLFRQLDNMMLTEDTKVGYGANTVKSIIKKTFISQKYLREEKEEGDIVYVRGARAEVEISEVDVLSFMSQEVFDEPIEDATIAYYREQQQKRKEQAGGTAGDEQHANGANSSSSSSSSGKRKSRQ